MNKEMSFPDRGKFEVTFQTEYGDLYIEYMQATGEESREFFNNM